MNAVTAVSQLLILASLGQIIGLNSDVLAFKQSLTSQSDFTVFLIHLISDADLVSHA